MDKPEELRPEIKRNFDQILQVANRCISNGERVAALVLVYSAIEAAAALDTPFGESKQRFTRWAERYIRPKEFLGCTALDLYGARCGVVHSFGSASGLSAGKKARQIVYSWHPSEKSVLQELTKVGRMQTLYVGVHGDDLIRVVGKGVEAFLRDLASDPVKLKRANSAASTSFQYMSDEDAMKLLKWGRELTENLKSE